jgi:hypothetical protein
MAGSGRDAATGAPDAGATVAQTPIAGSGAMVAQTPVAGSGAPPAAGHASDAGCVAACGAPAPSNCDALGSYGLRMTADVTWESTSGVDSGRGPFELYALLHVDEVDAQAGKLGATLRVCGLVLPTFTSSAACGSYQLQAPDSIWDQGSLAGLPLSGAYDCDASGCALRIEPASYLRGVELADVHGPWPEAGSTSESQFPDDDGDGVAGVSVDVLSSGSDGSGECEYWAAVPAGLTPTSPTAAPWGRLPLGLRAQLTAALKLDPACSLSELSATAVSLGVRAAGCLQAIDAGASAGCTEEIRAAFDESLPNYEVLGPGDVPAADGVRNKKPSEGPILKALRFPAPAAISCEQVRAAMF